jgi:hypothetical protein
MAMAFASLFLFAGVSAPGASGHKCTQIDHSNAGEVAAEFLKTAVTRWDSACSYDLVTEKMHDGLTRKQWATGDIPVVPFIVAKGHEKEVGAAVVANVHTDPAFIQNVIQMVAPGVGSFTFWIETVKQGNAWYVSYWGPYDPKAGGVSPKPKP